jgi:hypothetical protein
MGHTGSDAHLSACSAVTAGFFAESKTENAVSDRLPASNGEAKSEWSYSSTSHMPSWKGSINTKKIYFSAIMFYLFFIFVNVVITIHIKII